MIRDLHRRDYRETLLSSMEEAPRKTAITEAIVLISKEKTNGLQMSRERRVVDTDSSLRLFLFPFLGNLRED